MRYLTRSQLDALLEVADRLSLAPKPLAAEVQFESGWNPKIKNPTSSARGLIQFMDSTARGMGYAGSLDLVLKHPTIETQLRGPVLDYLKKWAPYRTDQSLFMAVFYPAYRYVGLDTEFPDNVQRWNPGIVTVRDYVDHVWSRVGTIDLSQTYDPVSNTLRAA